MVTLISVESVEDAILIITLLFFLVCVAKLGISLPNMLFKLASKIRRLDALDQDYCNLDFGALLSPDETNRSSKYRFCVRQKFESFRKTGLAVWADSVSLAAYLVCPSLLSTRIQKSRPQLSIEDVSRFIAVMPRLDNQRIVELGCGVGVLSLVLQRLLDPETVLATDGDENAVMLAGSNMERNDGKHVQVQQLRWGCDKDIKQALCAGKRRQVLFDVVIGSDITYWPAPLGLLKETILKLVALDGCVILAHKDRSKSSNRVFFDSLSAHFRENFHIFAADLADDIGQTGGDFSEEDGMHIFIYRGLLLPQGREE
jgi:2-polyprenyl-3-methyl-5-hydroxy-6-metoxy-1,4-benzoquinol methylase